MNKKWSIREIEYLETHANHMKDKDLCVKLNEMTGKNYTEIAVRKQRQKLGLKKKSGRGVSSLTDEVYKKQMEKRIGEY